jgi:hypothetical protein
MISYIYTGKLILTFEFNTPSSIFPYTQITNLKEKEKKREKHFDKFQLENARNHEKMQEHYKFRDAHQRWS